MISTIKVKANSNYLKLEIDRSITSGTIGLEVTFEFDETWNGLAKLATFEIGATSISVPIENDKCQVPWEVMADKHVGELLRIGICGMKDKHIIYPTTYVLVGKLLQGARSEGDGSTEKQPTLVEQIFEISQQALDTANSVRTDADNGVFDGADGVNGLSAYEIAVKNGFVGTEQEWLVSLEASVEKANTYTDTKCTEAVNQSKEYTDNSLSRPQHSTMIVTAMQEGIGFKSDYNANEIKRHADGGGVVILRFNAPDGTGEQSYPYETYKDGYAIFRRAYINKNTISRINIKIDDRYNVDKVDEAFVSASADDIQYLEDNKADYKLKVIAKDKVSQADAREVLAFKDQYDGKLIEFLTNGDNPNKAIATGRVFTDNKGDSYLVTYNLDGTTTVWNSDTYEKHNVESKNLINQMIDLDNLTLDEQGQAPYFASVQKAFNKPQFTSDFGIVFVIAYSIDKQIQIYRDITTGMCYTRTITGLADRHSFGGWVDNNSPILTSPNGSKYKLVVNDNGNLTTEKLQ